MNIMNVLKILQKVSDITILELDSDGKINNVIFNSNTDILVKKNQELKEIFSPKERKKVERIFTGGLGKEGKYLRISKRYSKGTQYVNTRIEDIDGKIYAYLVPGQPHREEELEYENRVQELSYKAETDQLTGLLNRHGYWERVKRILNCGDSGRKIGIIFLDMDKLTEINNTKGHKVGDKAINQLSSLIARTIRSRDIAVRYGGDEFLIIVEELSGKKSTAYGLAKRILREINQNKSKFLTTFSIGVHVTKVGKVNRKGITNTQLHRNWEEQVVIADTMAYKAKASGRNTIVFSKRKL